MRTDRRKRKIGVRAVRSAWVAGMRSVAEFRPYARKPWTAADWGRAQGLCDLRGGEFVVAMIGAMFAHWEEYEDLLLAPDAEFHPSMDWIAGRADSLALAAYARGDVPFEPRTVNVDWDNMTPIERAYRENLFAAMGRTGRCRWPWTPGHARIAAELTTRFGEERAALLVARVLRYWGRYRCLPISKLGAPSLRLIALFADGWIETVLAHEGPPPFERHSDAPELPRGACGEREATWRDAEARYLPHLPQGWRDRAWNERDKEVLDALVAAWGEAFIVEAIERFFATWERFKERTGTWAWPDHLAFKGFCDWWCPDTVRRRRAAEDARVDVSDFDANEEREFARMKEWIKGGGGATQQRDGAVVDAREIGSTDGG